MLMSLRCWSLAFLAACLFLSNAAHGKLGERFRDLTHNKGFARKQLPRAAVPAIEERASAASPYRFLNDKTKPFKVDSLPDIPFDIGEMYAGLIPISAHNKSRGLYYVFQPTVGAPVDEITIWLNGGPGCSSLEGFFQENGRFLWRWGQYTPTINDYAWVNLTNVLWVEQPVGTGFSIGDATATSEEDIAKDFVDWFHNFGRTFNIKNFKIYVTGESYAGRYVPYISAAMLDKNDTQNFNLKGALAYDPCIGSYEFAQEEVVAVPYVKAYNNIIGLNDTFMAQLEAKHESCGYADYLDKYLTFPASGVQPPKYFNGTSEADCDVFNDAINAAFNPNPCFNVYQIAGTCPLLSDPLGFPTSLIYSYPGQPVYFNRDDVKKAMHAPEGVEWAECSGPVFTGAKGSGPEDDNDISADPIQSVLPRVIEATNRVLISNADLDMIIITNGTLLAIQNMTWNGGLGFKEAPSKPIVIDLPDLEYGPLFVENFGEAFEDPQGTTGVQHYERGLMWAETFLSGHMQPQFQPRTSYRHLQWLLGHIETL